MAIVVSDTSPIRALDHLGLLSIVGRLYGQVYIPDAVANELRRATRRFSAFDPGAHSFLLVQSPRDTSRVAELERRLDIGEAAALVLAMELQADLVLIDETVGRAVARELGIPVIGVLGILIEAKEHRLIAVVRPLIERLQNELDFFLSPALVTAVLKRTNEMSDT
jgi:hypothetical protein